MKKAKIILASLVLLSVIGGIFAFKAARQPRNIWTVSGTKLSTILVGTLTYSTTIPNCTLTALATTNVGPNVIVSYSSTSDAVKTVFTRAGQPDFPSTYLFCTTILTKTTIADE